MSTSALNGSSQRNSPFTRNARSSPISPSIMPPLSQYRGSDHPKPAVTTSPASISIIEHNRNQSSSPLGSVPLIPSHPRSQSCSNRNNNSSPSAPQFIKSPDGRDGEPRGKGIE